jgi:hypothetical protein
MTSHPFGAKRLAVVAVLAIQIACGGSDASGPGPKPASIEANSSTTITAPAGSVALERPSVIVRDEHGDPLAGVPVEFTVTSGGGSVTGHTAQTDLDGIATVGNWTLGTSAARNTVDATVASLPAVTFVANAGDPCEVTTAHPFGTTSTGKLTLADCQFNDGSFVDLFAVSTPATNTYLFEQESTAFDSYILLLSTDFVFIGENDDVTSNNPNSRIKAILPAGDWIVAANSIAPNSSTSLLTGSYTVHSSVTSDPVTNCEDAFVARGITTQQSLQTTDCSQNGVLADVYYVFLNTGQTVTVTMTSPAIDSYLQLVELRTNGSVAQNDDTDASTKNASLSYTAATFGYYYIIARTTTAGTTGAYTLTVQ